MDDRKFLFSGLERSVLLQGVRGRATFVKTLMKTQPTLQIPKKARSSVTDRGTGQSRIAWTPGFSGSNSYY
jgi:hypothetical protein